jgi:hypothetical protein
MDEKGPDGGPSLFDLCKADPVRNLRAKVWQDFYVQFAGLSYGPEPGMLPFRVRHIYEAMVDYLKAGKMKEFLASAGILTHYVADACIPLHFSALHHGYAPKALRDSAEYKAYRKTPEYKIHSLFEQRMFEVRAEEMLQMINDKLAGKKAKPTVSDGSQAIVRVFNLMSEIYSLLPPEKIISIDNPKLTQRERAEIQFKAVGDKAAECVAKGCLVLSELVESAWKAGNGDRIFRKTNAHTYSEAELQNLYRSPGFLPARTFDELIRKGY